MQQQPVYPSAKPALRLKTNRGWLKTLLLSLITFDIYGIVFLSNISTDINILASRYDGRKTMHFCLLFFIFVPLTLTVGAFVWFHRLSARIDRELSRRGLPYHFGADTFWLWSILGALIGIGPFIYLHKLCKAMNYLCDDFNARG